MSLQGCIENLFVSNSNYLYPEQAFNQAASLQTLSEDLYTDPCRFVYELIQNADDAAGTNLQIALIDPNYLIVSHDGTPFNENDVRSLCSVNSSTKIRNARTTGYKGLGFKAVFGKSDYVLIMTKNECFRFDEKYAFKWRWEGNQKLWKRENGREFIYPWQICPIWTRTEEIPSPVRIWLSNSKKQMPINIIIWLHNADETRNALQELIKQPYTFLFLQRLQRLEFLGKIGPSLITRESEENGVIKLSDNRNQPSRWLISRRGLNIPPEIRRNDRRLPEKLRQMSSTEISLAARFDPENPRKFSRMSIDRDQSALFAYMPTKISAYNLPLLTNVNCLTNANREQIHMDSAWNQWLFERIPIVTMQWIEELSRQGQWNDAIYDLLPSHIRGNDIISNNYNQGCSTALTTAKFIRNTQGNYLSIHEAIIDSTQLSTKEFIGNEPIRRFILHEYKPPPRNLPSHPFVLDHPNLRELNVRAFDWEDAIYMFHSKEFQRDFSVNRSIKLIAYLYDKRTDKEISRLLHRLPFLMDRNGRLQILTHIFFPSKFYDPQWDSPDCPDAYMHNDLVSKLPSEHQQWLRQLGVTEKTDLTFFYCTILPNAQIFITPDNALFTIRRLMNLCMNGQIPPDDLRKLGKLSLLTKANTFAPANRLYLSFAYQPRLPLDTELSTMPQLFVSPLYMMDAFPELWKHFFLLLGVYDNIELTILNISNCRDFPIYHADQTRIIFGINSQQIHRYQYLRTILFLELTEDNFQFATFFWKHVIKTIKIDDLDKSERAYWGAPGKPGAIHGSEVNTFPQWFTRMRSCIPVQLELTDGTIDQKCFKGPDVYTSALSVLTGRYLPTFECTPDEPTLSEKWAHFFHFKTELPIDDHFYILYRIHLRNQTNLNNDDEKRIQAIYANLLKLLCKTTAQQRIVHREKCQSMNIFFLSERHDFISPEQLSVCLVDNFEPAAQYFTLKLSPENRRHTNLSNLLDVFGIAKIEEKDFNIRPVNEHVCNELANRLDKSHFFVLFDHHKIKNKDQLNQLQNIQYIEADRFELYTINENQLIGTISFYFHNHTFYIQSPWNTKAAIDCLTERLCDLLKLSSFSFQTHINTLLTSSSIEDYFTQLGIHLTSKEQSTNASVPEDVTLSQLLLINLENQRPHWTGCIYHYTHLENAVSILRDQTLKSRHLCSKDSFRDCSGYDLMSERDDQVNHYVRFYFRPLTQTQHNNENLGRESSKKHNKYTPMCPVPIFFSIDLSAVLSLPNLRWKISLGDMSESLTEYGCTPEILQKMHFSSLFAESNNGHAQSEFLIEGQLDFHDLPAYALTLLYQNADAQQSLESIIDETKRNFRCEVSPKNYFNNNPRIHINHDRDQDHISIHIDRKTQRSNEMFIVQIKSDNHNLACQGNISAVIHHQHTTTIYSKQTPFDVFVAQQNYAVYYRYEDRDWLIYTNHNRPEFDRSHLDQYSYFTP